MEEMGDRARALLKKIQQGDEQAASSTLTFDELVWVVKKYRTLEDAIVAGEAFLNMPSLTLIPVDRDLLASASEIIKRYRLDPRDSIHAASAIFEKIGEIVSTDKHLDRIKEFRRKPL
ncbi:MAG: type II toxin-antitoxin system VapC family toxin [Nitrososphaerales archaeon]|nr:type II toxin-antitoxin system VapC family toxin [Nitrososphaerales archaeon]